MPPSVGIGCPEEDRQDPAGAALETTRRPAATVGARKTRARLRGPPGSSPGPSTDFAVTDGLRWSRSRLAQPPSISQNGRRREPPHPPAPRRQTAGGAPPH